jgi:hypothetical protein
MKMHRSMADVMKAMKKSGGRLPAGLQGIMPGGAMPKLPPGAFGGRR